MSLNAHKTWLSPILAVSFLTTAVTGVLMLMHLHLPGMRALHDWGGLFFIVAGILHLLLNWRIFISYFRKKKGIIGVTAGVIILALIGSLLSSQGGHGGRHQGQGYGKGNHAAQHF